MHLPLGCQHLLDQVKIAHRNAAGGDDEIRSLVTFKRMNLLEPFVGIGPFDIIFCRNVAIYFTPDERSRLFTKLGGILEPNGYLFIGSTESLTNDTDLFTPQKYLKAIFYQMKKRNSCPAQWIFQMNNTGRI